MNKKLTLIVVVVLLFAATIACRFGRLEPTVTPVPTVREPATSGEETGGETESEAGSETGEGATNPYADIGVQDDVPIMDNPIELVVTANGTYIRYKVVSTVEAASEYYKTRLEELGFSAPNKQDVGFGGSMTLLRSKEDKNITITLQSIPESEEIRVLISVINK
jgi:hypothetical protein